MITRLQQNWYQKARSFCNKRNINPNKTMKIELVILDTIYSNVILG